jgi:plasmid stability protein
MRQLTIRNIDDAIYRRLKERAKLGGRSLEAEVRAILAGAAIPDRSDLVRRAAAMRARLRGRYRGDATRAIREDRER